MWHIRRNPYRNQLKHMHRIHREQIVRTSLEQAWNFIKDPRNLNAITPDALDFEIISDVPPEMVNGLLIEYRIKIPFLGRQRWLTEIKHIRPMQSFVDEQRLGPYRFWYHYHELQDTGSGVKIIDDVTYAAPFGIIGRCVNFLIIRKMLEKIFNHRAEMFEKLLSNSG
jgi:ligand-binding SRPBCC domain-containing protein